MRQWAPRHSMESQTMIDILGLSGAAAPPCVKEYGAPATSFAPFSRKSLSSPHHMSDRVAASMPEAPCKYQVRSPLHWQHSNQCQMRCAFWLKDILLGVTDSHLEAEAPCVGNERPPLRQRRGSVHGTGAVARTMEPWTRIVEWRLK